MRWLTEDEDSDDDDRDVQDCRHLIVSDKIVHAKARHRPHRLRLAEIPCYGHVFRGLGINDRRDFGTWKWTTSLVKRLTDAYIHTIHLMTRLYPSETSSGHL